METDALIAARLGERQRKIDRINEIRQSENKGKIRPVMYGLLSAVACIAIVIAVMPGLFHDNSLSSINLEQPSFQQFRGSAANGIEAALESRDYAAALKLTNDAILESTRDLQEYQTMAVANNEETEYLEIIERQNLEGLMWTRIYILVKSGDESDVTSACDAYMEHADFQEYRQEVIKILKKLEK